MSVITAVDVSESTMNIRVRELHIPGGPHFLTLSIGEEGHGMPYNLYLSPEQAAEVSEALATASKAVTAQASR